MAQPLGLPRLLVAGLEYAMRDIVAALAHDALAVKAETYDAAVKVLKDERPAAIVIAYHFDEIRPFRFIRQVRDDPALRNLPIVLVRVLAISMGTTQEAELRSTYRGLGVDEYFNLHDEAKRAGLPAALDRFRGVVIRQLFRAGGVP